MHIYTHTYVKYASCAKTDAVCMYACMYSTKAVWQRAMYVPGCTAKGTGRPDGQCSSCSWECH